MSSLAAWTALLQGGYRWQKPGPSNRVRLAVDQLSPLKHLGTKIKNSSTLLLENEAYLSLPSCHNAGDTDMLDLGAVARTPATDCVCKGLSLGESCD